MEDINTTLERNLELVLRENEDLRGANRRIEGANRRLEAKLLSKEKEVETRMARLVDCVFSRLKKAYRQSVSNVEGEYSRYAEHVIKPYLRKIEKLGPKKQEALRETAFKFSPNKYLTDAHSLDVLCQRDPKWQAYGQKRDAVEDEYRVKEATIRNSLHDKLLPLNTERLKRIQQLDDKYDEAVATITEAFEKHLPPSRKTSPNP